MFGERVAWGVECDDPAAAIQAAAILPGRHRSMMGPIMGIAWAMPPASAERKKPPDACASGGSGDVRTSRDRALGQGSVPNLLVVFYPGPKAVQELVQFPAEHMEALG